MIALGEVYCTQCEDPFYPDGQHLIDGPNFCSGECEDAYLNEQAYNEARYGSAPVF